jgi:tetratricopeptide (TPR) repeat protein
MSAAKEFVMRYYPAAIAISLFCAVSASVGNGAVTPPARSAVVLQEQGRAALQAGQTQAAIDAFETALAIDPAYTALYLDLARAARNEGLQGKAIHYYRQALEREPNNFAAISGEGEALAEKGALEKARRNLAQLKSLCGDTCAETRALTAKLAEAPATKPVLTAEAVTPTATVTQN